MLYIWVVQNNRMDDTVEYCTNFDSNLQWNHHKEHKGERFHSKYFQWFHRFFSLVLFVGRWRNSIGEKHFQSREERISHHCLPPAYHESWIQIWGGLDPLLFLAGSCITFDAEYWQACRLQKKILLRKCFRSLPGSG